MIYTKEELQRRVLKLSIKVRAQEKTIKDYEFGLQFIIGVLHGVAEGRISIKELNALIQEAEKHLQKN